MVDIFEEEMCNYCKKTNCNKKVIIEEDKHIIIYKCNEYEKDSKKIIPYEKPIIVTAKRDYITSIEV